MSVTVWMGSHNFKSSIGQAGFGYNIFLEKPSKSVILFRGFGQNRSFLQSKYTGNFLNFTKENKWA